MGDLDQVTRGRGNHESFFMDLRKGRHAPSRTETTGGRCHRSVNRIRGRKTSLSSGDRGIFAGENSNGSLDGGRTDKHFAQRSRQKPESMSFPGM